MDVEGARLRRVLVIGTGLIGTSVALALRARGVEVLLADRDPAAVRMAVGLGAGIELPGPPGAGSAPGSAPGQGPTGDTDLAVLAVPPASVGRVLRDVQERGLARASTDVASVKAIPLADARRRGADLSAFVAGHPLAGRERSGPAAARADLFRGRPWALCPVPETDPGALALVRALVLACGAEPVEVPAPEHDRAVALVSHAPHLAASVMAARLLAAPSVALGLAGQGVRDVTRVAAGDPALWTDILRANAVPVAEVVEEMAADLMHAAQALRKLAGGDAASAGGVTDLLDRGRAGRGRLPGKHGSRPPDYTAVPVVVADRPGELSRLFQAAGECGVNIEDVAIEHSPGLPAGVVELYVRPEAADPLARALVAAGWSVHR